MVKNSQSITKKETPGTFIAVENVLRILKKVMYYMNVQFAGRNFILNQKESKDLKTKIFAVLKGVMLLKDENHSLG